MPKYQSTRSLTWYRSDHGPEQSGTPFASAQTISNPFLECQSIANDCVRGDALHTPNAKQAAPGTETKVRPDACSMPSQAGCNIYGINLWQKID